MGVVGPAANTGPTGAAGTRRGLGAPKWVPAVFMAPYMALFSVFVLVPAVYGLWISAHSWDFTLPNRAWVGLQNYADLFDSTSVQFPPFWRGMSNTGIFTVLSVPLLVTVPLMLAIMLHREFPGRTFFRAMFFAPYVLGIAVIGVMWRYLLDGNFGLINYVFHTNIQWTTDQPWAWIALVGVTVWWTMGFNAIIYLAGLGDIPQEQYEAASLDGASAWQQFRYVTVPGLRPVLVFILVTTILASANMFGQSYIITAGGPSETTRTAIMVIADTGFKQNNAGQAAAESYVLAVALALVSILNFWFLRDKDARAMAKATRKSAAAGARVEVDA